MEPSWLVKSNKVSSSFLPGYSQPAVLGITRIMNPNNKQWRYHSCGIMPGSAHLITHLRCKRVKSERFLDVNAPVFIDAHDFKGALWLLVFLERHLSKHTFHCKTKPALFSVSACKYRENKEHNYIFEGVLDSADIAGLLFHPNHTICAAALTKPSSVSACPRASRYCY